MTRNGMLVGVLAVLVAVAMGACGGAGRNPVAPGPVNQPPAIVRIELVGFAAAGFGSQLPVRAETRDPEGDPVACRWSASAGRVLVDSANTCAGVYFAPTSGASDRIEATPTDSGGATGSVGSLTVPLGPDSVAVGGASPSPGPNPTPRPDASPTPRPGPAPTPGPTPTPAPPNSAPTVSVSGGGSCHPNPTCSRSFAASASDPEGDPMTYTWTGTGCSGTGATGNVTINAIQSFTCTVTVRDDRGASASATGTAVGTNSTPTISSPGGRDPITCGATRCAWLPDRSGTLAAGVSDDDSGGGTCTAAARGSCHSATCSASGSEAVISIETGSGGDCFVDIVWTDRWGARSATATDWYPVSSNPGFR